MKQIVIATDGSPAAGDAVRTGLELAVDEGAAVTFVHVLPPDQWFVGTRMAPSFPIPHHVGGEEEEAALTAAAEEAEKFGVSYVLERIAGPTVQSIVAIAAAKEADLIVVGSRGHGEVASALLGSVSRGVLREANRPVLIVRAQVPSRAGAAA